MTDVQLNSDEVAARARALIEADVNTRVEAVRVLADAANEADAAEQRFKEATSAHERAWTAALNAGWAERELRATGVRAPGQSPRRGRGRRAFQPSDSPTSET
ncbi:hypothetical protein ACPW96_21330 [Micromonospora sp. DT81.3]|uniref:hypothetical protein n=1 Tax=Micromonospora sp. DT81.3 TaxID=3416523 RepID=UPI003CEC74CB